MAMQMTKAPFGPGPMREMATAVESWVLVMMWRETTRSWRTEGESGAAGEGGEGGFEKEEVEGEGAHGF